jgi:hypothetical protein
MDAKRQEQEFDELLARAGLTPSPSDRDAALPIAVELMRSAEMMRQPRQVGDAPSYIHSLVAILKAAPK